MEIRIANMEDLDILCQMYDELYALLCGEYGYPFAFSGEENRRALAVQLGSRLCRLLLAEEEGQAMGFVHASVAKLERRLSYQGQKLIGRIEDIYVREGARGSGAAARLLTEAEKWFQEQDIALVDSFILSDNEGSRKFHAKHGFLPMATRMHKRIQ